MTSVGLMLPEPGYLAAVRELTRRHGVVLIFDEVKTGLTIAAGGAVERLGAQPGHRHAREVARRRAPDRRGRHDRGASASRWDGGVRQIGTYNGNPLWMAAARASLREVLTPAAYEELERLGARMVAGCDAVIDDGGRALRRLVSLGSKGCVQRGRADPELARADLAVAHEPRRVHHAGREQEWNVTRRPRREAVDRYVEVFGGLLAELTPRLSGSARA